MRCQSGKATVGNIRKLSVVRAIWATSKVEDTICTDKARAAFRTLLRHNLVYAQYVADHNSLVEASFPKGRKIPTYFLLMQMPGIEAAIRPILYPHTVFCDTDLRERLRAFGYASPPQQLSIKRLFFR